MTDVDGFIKVWNDVENYPTVADVADHLGRAVSSVKNRASLLRDVAKSHPGRPVLINRAVLWRETNPSDLVKEKIRSAHNESKNERLVTEKQVRERTDLTRDDWEPNFGTFLEARRQSGVALTRGQNLLKLHTARHASQDPMRAMNEERQSYGEKYDKPTQGNFKTIIAASDIHDIEADSFYLRVLIDTVARVQPDVICLTGDIFDLPEFGKYGVDPREWDVCGRIKFAHENILRPLREAAPNAQIDFIEGNHEHRLLRHLGEATPALKSVLSDLHGLTVSKLLGLDRFEVNYIAKADLGMFSKQDQARELAKNYKIYWNCFLAHHFPHARNMGLPGWNGHHHSHIVWPMMNPIYQSYEWHQLGSGHKRMASYAEGERWSMGFAIAHCNTATLSTAFDYVSVGDFAVSGGKFYGRSEDERYGDRSLFAA